MFVILLFNEHRVIEFLFVQEMERRKRVEAIMNSVAFREELEKIVECQLSEGYSGVQTLQNISELIGIPAARVNMFRSECPPLLIRFLKLSVN